MMKSLFFLWVYSYHIRDQEALIIVSIVLHAIFLFILILEYFDSILIIFGILKGSFKIVYNCYC